MLLSIRIKTPVLKEPSKPGLWIRINFLRIRIQVFFLMRIGIKLLYNADPDPAEIFLKTNYTIRFF